MKKNMHLDASHLIFKNADKLRKRETPAEKKLWTYLKDRRMDGEKFRRQHPFKKFVADFYCYKLRLVIELDGAYHSTSSQKFYDEDRSEILDHENVTFIRIPNHVVMDNIESALEHIKSKIQNLKEQRQKKSKI